MALIPPKAPNLPIAPEDYTSRFIDQLNNVLRLYFNQIDNFGSGLLNSSGAGSLSFPFIGAYYYPDQYATADNTATKVLWNGTSGISGFTFNPDGTATPTYSGYYKITYSLELANSDNAAHDVMVWLRVDGVDVPESTTIFTVPARKSTGVPSYVCGYSEVLFRMEAGQTVALWWGTEKAASSGGVTGIHIYSRAAKTTPMAYPTTPSAIGSITFVSSV